MRLLPRRIAGRTMLTLFLGLTLSHILSILVFSSEKLEAALQSHEQRILEQAASITRLLIETPKTYHEAIFAALNRSLPGARLAHQPELAVLENDSGDDSVELRQQLEQMINHPEAKVLAVRKSDGASPMRWLHGLVMEQELTIVIAFSDQHRYVFHSSPQHLHVPIYRNATLSVVLMAAAIIVFSLLIVRHLTVPLQHVVKAAEAFGRDVYSPPLPERGSLEATMAARVFNEMNQRIRDYVEERTRMIAAISHDLRTPLTQLRLRMEFMDKTEDQARMSATLDEMEAMLTSTLEFARDAAATESKHRVNMNSLLSAICSDLADTGLPVTWEDSERLPLLCRPLAMKRALTNIILNGIYHGGAAHVSMKINPDEVVIVVHDQGPGIPEAEWGNVFKPFYRLDPSRSAHSGGAGLGLSVAATVVRDHFGAIGFIKPEGQGFITQITLPRGLTPRSHSV